MHHSKAFNQLIQAIDFAYQNCIVMDFFNIYDPASYMHTQNKTKEHVICILLNKEET